MTYLEKCFINLSYRKIYIWTSVLWISIFTFKLHVINTHPKLETCYFRRSVGWMWHMIMAIRLFLTHHNVSYSWTFTILIKDSPAGKLLSTYHLVILDDDGQRLFANLQMKQRPIHWQETPKPVIYTAL